MTIQVLTDEEIDVMRDYIIGNVDPRALESALISKLAAGELPEVTEFSQAMDGLMEPCENGEWVRVEAAYQQAQLARAQGAASMLSSEPSAHLDVVMGCAYTPKQIQGSGKYFTPLFSLNDFK